MEFSARLVRELKGAPLACLVLMMIADQPVSSEWLMRMSGYSDKPITQAMRLLSGPEYQIAARARGGGWRLVDGSKQLPLQSRKYSDSAADLNTLSVKNNNINNAAAGDRKKSDSDYDDCLQVCKDNGIFPPAAEEIANLEHVTPALINAHIDAQKPGEGIGLVILRLRNNEKPRKPRRADDPSKYISGNYSDCVEH